MENQSSNAIPRISTVSSVLASCFFIALGLYYSPQEPGLLTRYTKEDGFIEWMTFFLYFSSALFAIFVLLYRKLFKVPATFFQNLVLAGIAFIFFFGAMEEISWFQRILEIESGEFFAKHNRQSETNLHNMIVGGVNINKLIFGKVFAIALIAHNVILPLVARKNLKVKAWFLEKGIFLPPAALVVPYLVLVIAVEFFISHARAKEHLEVLGSIHYFSCLFYAYGLGGSFYDRKELFAFDDRKAKILWSIAFAMFMLLLTIASWMLGHMSLKGFEI